MGFGLHLLNFSFVLVWVGLDTTLGVPGVHGKGQNGSSFPKRQLQEDLFWNTNKSLAYSTHAK